MSDLRKINEIDPDSEYVFVPTLIKDHYPARPNSGLQIKGDLKSDFKRVL